jgi:glycosyltransferase involved in cell wall biosynthesis
MGNADGVRHHWSRFTLRQPQARLPWEQAALPLVARRAGVEVFHFLDHVMSVVPPARRTVVTIHDATPIRMPETFGRVRGRYKGLMTRLSAHSASRIITVSRATRDDLSALLGVPERRTSVVYSGLDPVFRPVRDPATLAAVRARYGLPPRFLIYLGRIEPRKNVDRLLRGYALARERFGVQIPLVLVGKPSWLYTDTLHLPAQLGIAEHVLLTDYLPQADLPAVYSQAEALVFATLYEGFGLPLLEAMACGTPVITSNVSSMPEVVGDVGLLVDPLSVEQIAGAIARVLEDQALRARLREAGPERARHFTWERAAQETVAVYEEAAAC